jgi:hypothetical protein
LGLKHIWGDTYCGDDLVDDTPKQGNFTSGCPNSFRSSCTNGPMGDMYMNYMDYTGDACMNLFTVGQKERMLRLFDAGGPKFSLLSSKGLMAPWVEAPPVSVQDSSTTFAFYPNPVKNEVTFRFEDGSWVGQKLIIYTVNGTVQQSAIITGSTQKLNVSSLTTGVYFIQITKGNTRIREKMIKL